MTMRFLIDADLPRSASEVVRRHAHEAIDVRDIGLRSAKDPEIARYAGIVVLYLPRTATAAYINQLLDSLLEQKELLTQLPGQLAIVEPGRIRLRGT